MNDLEKALQTFVVEQSNIIAAKLNNGFKEKTRVDTGYARSRWQIRNGVTKPGDTARITNDADYIGWLNYGTPYTAGDFMVERTIQEVQREYK